MQWEQTEDPSEVHWQEFVSLIQAEMNKGDLKDEQ